MILLLNLCIIGGLLYLGMRWVRRSPISIFYWPAVILKLSSGVLIGLLYAYYYDGGDTYAFFESAVRFKSIALESRANFVNLVFKSNYQAYPDFQYTWIPTAFFIKLLALLVILTDGNYWLSGLYLSLFSFMGFWLWTNTLINLTGNKVVSIISGFLVPSILFWSSGIMKETIAMPALAVVLSLFVKLYFGEKLRWRQIFVGILLFAILAITKYFVAAIFLAVFFALLLSRKILPSEGHWGYEILVLGGFMVLSAGFVSLLHPNLWPTRIAEVIFNNYQNYYSTSAGSALVIYPSLTSEPLSILANFPKATFNGLFLPLLPIAGSIPAFASVMENWLLLLSTVLVFGFLKLPGTRDQRLLVWSALLFVIISAGFIALSTPNLGTLARYKISYLIVYTPLLMSGIFNLYRKYLNKA